MIKSSALFGAVMMVAAALPVASYAAPQGTTVSGVYNTGVDNAGNKLSLGAADSHYTVTTANGLAYVYSNGAYVTTADAQFISPSADGSGGSRTYSTTFNLTGYNLASASLSGFAAADDFATIFLNGVQIGSVSNPGYGSLTQFTTSANFIPGLNTLSFGVVDSGGAPSGLLVSKLMVTAIATPGPIAGAGIPAILGLVGAWSLRRRRASRNA